MEVITLPITGDGAFTFCDADCELAARYGRPPYLCNRIPSLVRTALLGVGMATPLSNVTDVTIDCGPQRLDVDGWAEHIQSG